MIPASSQRIIYPRIAEYCGTHIIKAARSGIWHSRTPPFGTCTLTHAPRPAILSVYSGFVDG